jgi:hypothetical protein
MNTANDDTNDESDQPCTIAYDMKQNREVIITETSNGVSVTAAETGERIGDFDTVTAMERSNAVDVRYIPEHIVNDPVEYMTCILQKGIETCLEHPAYDDVHIMYADTKTTLTSTTD